MSREEENELAFAGPLELSRRVREREISARQLVELSLARIERIDPRLNAFRETLPDLALTTASQIDGGAMEGAGRWPACRSPSRTTCRFAGYATMRGSKSPAQPQPLDAEPLRRLRLAGAIPIGITRVPELMLFPWTASDAGGVTRNPWDLTRTPGGSSGGSAAAVAAGLVPAAGASDGGGSIRIPAACCGLVGMKPTRGRVSSQPMGDGWLGLATFGALARTVADSALLLDVIQGSAPGDRYSVAPPRGTFLQAAQTPPAGPLRIAISTKLPPGTLARLSADQRLAFEQAARLLSELGHEVIERDPSYGTVSLEFIQSYLRGAHEEFETLWRERSAEGSTRQLAAIGGRLVLGAPPRSSARQAAADDRAHHQALERVRRAADAGSRHDRRSPPRADTASRRHSRSRRPGASCRGTRRSMSPGSPRSRCRPGSAPMGCRSACSSSGARATRSCSTRSRVRSRLRGHGQATGRRSSML